jgi:hypothetical protein
VGFFVVEQTGVANRSLHSKLDLCMDILCNSSVCYTCLFNTEKSHHLFYIYKKSKFRLATVLYKNN